MGWRDKLRTASFRGVKFEVASTDRNAGRRLQTHEYPLRDTPYTEDLGRSARQYSVEGFLVGKDYLSRLNSLLAALESSGPGTLVHPYYGTMQVCVDGQGTRVSHSKDEGGMCRFYVSFVEAGKLSNPISLPSIGGLLGSAASKLLSVAVSSFVKRYVTDGLPAFVPAAATSFLTKAIKLTTSNVLNASALAGDVVTWSQTLDLPAAVAAVSADYAVPSNIATPARKQIKTNITALAGLVKSSAVAQMAQQAIDAEWNVYQPAVAAMNEYSSYIDEVMEDADDDTYRELSQVRTLLVKHIRREITDAKRLTTYAPAQNMPALAVSHRLYGDASRDSEIVARNGVRHPGFTYGSLQVLES